MKFGNAVGKEHLGLHRHRIKRKLLLALRELLAQCWSRTHICHVEEWNVTDLRLSSSLYFWSVKILSLVLQVEIIRRNMKDKANKGKTPFTSVKGLLQYTNRLGVCGIKKIMIGFDLLIFLKCTFLQTF